MLCYTPKSLQKENYVKANMANIKPKSTKNRFSVHIKVMSL